MQEYPSLPCQMVEVAACLDLVVEGEYQDPQVEVEVVVDPFQEVVAVEVGPFQEAVEVVVDPSQEMVGVEEGEDDPSQEVVEVEVVVEDLSQVEVEEVVVELVKEDGAV